MGDGAHGISSGPGEGTDWHGWETGGQLCGQSTLSIACAGVEDTEEARLIQIRVTAEKQGWRREERGRGLWSGPTIRPDLPVPPPTTTPVTISPWWALGHDCGWRCIQAASPLGNYKTELYDPAMEKYQPSPQWINLFVFVKDPENKVRQALTLCSPAPFTRPPPSAVSSVNASSSLALRFLDEGPSPHRQEGSRKATLFANCRVTVY